MELDYIGERIQSKREKQGMSHEEFAEEVGITVISLYRIEQGINKPKLQTFINMCKVLNVSADELLGLGKR